MASIARDRLTQERKEWQKDHPFGFYAKPQRGADGSSNLLVWECGIPARKDSPWAGREPYRLVVTFTDEYPQRPPECKFSPPLFHPNVYPSGTVCLSILNEDKDWVPTITVKQVLLGIQDLLDNPNLGDPAQREAFLMCRDDRANYIEKVKQLAKIYDPKAGAAAGAAAR
jgi:ubiquitin-conjugating enzyme E2 I